LRDRKTTTTTTKQFKTYYYTTFLLYLSNHTAKKREIRMDGNLCIEHNIDYFF